MVIICLFFILGSVSAADNNVTNDKSIVKVHDDSLIENNSNLIKSSNEDNLLKASVKTFEYDGEVHTTSEIQTAVNEGYSIINLGGNSFKKNGVVKSFRDDMIIDGNGAVLYGTSGNSGFFQVTGM